VCPPRQPACALHDTGDLDGGEALRARIEMQQAHLDSTPISANAENLAFPLKVCGIHEVATASSSR
jgi:hypothetical protein